MTIENFIQDIETGIKNAAAFEATLSTNLANLANSGADSFVIYVDDFVPVAGTKYEHAVRKDAAHLFTVWEKWTRKLMGPQFEDAAVRNPAMLSDSFAGFVQTFTEQKMVGYQRDFNKSMEDRVAQEWQHSDFDGIRAQVAVEQHQENKRAEAQILADLNTELAAIEQRSSAKQYPAKRGKR